MKPILFIEYEPHLMKSLGINGLSIFQALKSVGYTTALFFENWGDYLLSVSLEDTQQIVDLHHYYSGRKSSRYCDICFVHGEDVDLAENIRTSEIDFSKKICFL